MTFNSANGSNYKPGDQLPCIVECLYSKYGQDESTIVDVKRIKTHVLKNYVKDLIDRETLRADKKTLCGVLDTAVFDLNKKAINNDYEDYVHRVGDFDERIFSSPDALSEIGTPVKAAFNSIASFEEHQHQHSHSAGSSVAYPARRNLQSQFDGSHHLAQATPLTGRNFLKAKEPGSVTPVSTATQSVSRLQALVSGRQTGPGEDLAMIFRECADGGSASNPELSIKQRVKEMGDKFCQHYSSNNHADDGRIANGGNGNGSSNSNNNSFSLDMARKRLQLGESLYYKVLGNIINDEKKRLKPGTNLSGKYPFISFDSIRFIGN